MSEEVEDDNSSAYDSEEEELEELNHNNEPVTLYRNRSLNPQLPSTVTTLIWPENAGLPNLPTGSDVDAEKLLEDMRAGKVYVVGTAHFSQESQSDVHRTIAETQPDVVMVELCHNRLTILSLDEETLLKEAKELTTEKMMTTIKQSGLIQGVMNILLLSMSANITKQLGMAPGGEFRRALHSAREIPCCRMDLGDRPVEITLQRALGSLNWWKKIRLFFYILLSHNSKISKEDVEKCKERDILEELLAELAGEYPELSRIFVEERDTYMANRLGLLLRNMTMVKRKNWNPENEWEPAVVVGVVGMGHVPGITQNWGKSSDVSTLLKVPPPSRFGKLFKIGLLGAALGAGVAGVYLSIKAARFSIRAAGHLLEMIQ